MGLRKPNLKQGSAGREQNGPVLQAAWKPSTSAQMQIQILTFAAQLPLGSTTLCFKMPATIHTGLLRELNEIFYKRL